MRVGGQRRTVDAGAQRQALARALAGLRGAEREALLMQAWAGLSYEEIALATGVPIGTVRSRLHRARHHVRAHLDDPEAS